MPDLGLLSIGIQMVSMGIPNIIPSDVSENFRTSMLRTTPDPINKTDRATSRPRIRNKVSSVFIQSENYPRNYPNNVDKTYTVNTSPGNIIEIRFTDFSLEYNRHCSWDWVMIKEGTGATLLPKTCGSSIPAVIKSQTNKVEIIFHSDYSVTKKGFKLEWKSLTTTTSSCCNSLNVVGKYFANGEYKKLSEQHNGRAIYKHTGKGSPGWCIFFGGHWKIETCDWLTKSDGSRGYGWSQVNTMCPGNIGPQWRYYSWTGGSGSGPVDAGIKVDCIGIQANCPDGWLKLGSNCYKFNSKTLSWNDARSFCGKEGGDLASIHSEEENQFIASNSGANTWLGGSDTVNEGQWVWSDGSAFDWKPNKWGVSNGEPNGGTSENCLVSWGSSGQEWNDATCRSGWWATKFVCKITRKTVFRQGYSYKYFPYNKQRFNFQVKAKYDAHIAFDSDENESDLYEIVIGGWGNSLSMVRRGKQGPNLGTGPVDMGSTPGQKGWTRTPKILSSSEFRGFWITTEYKNNKLEIKVGKDGESTPFMSGSDANPLKIRRVGLSAFTDVATYIF